MFILILSLNLIWLHHAHFTTDDRSDGDHHAQLDKYTDTEKKEARLRDDH